MTKADIETFLRNLIAEKLDLSDPSKIPSNVPLFGEGLGLDSMSGLEILTAIEERFDIYIDDDEFDVFDSLDSLVSFVQNSSSTTP